MPHVCAQCRRAPTSESDVVGLDSATLIDSRHLSMSPRLMSLSPHFSSMLSRDKLAFGIWPDALPRCGLTCGAFNRATPPAASPQTPRTPPNAGVETPDATPPSTLSPPPTASHMKPGMLSQPRPHRPGVSPAEQTPLSGTRESLPALGDAACLTASVSRSLSGPLSFDSARCPRQNSGRADYGRRPAGLQSIRPVFLSAPRPPAARPATRQFIKRRRDIKQECSVHHFYSEFLLSILIYSANPAKGGQAVQPTS